MKLVVAAAYSILEPEHAPRGKRSRCVVELAAVELAAGFEPAT